MSEEKKNICRVCLSTTKRKYVSLFRKQKNYYLFDQINSLANVHIRENDGYPDKICRGCLTELETAIGFRQKCESSYLILQNTFLTQPIENPEIDVKDIDVKNEEPSELEPIEECTNDHLFDDEPSEVEPIEECTDDHLFDGEPSEVEPIEESTDGHLFDDEPLKVEPIEKCTDDHLFDGEPSEEEPIEESTDGHLFDDEPLKVEPIEKCTDDHLFDDEPSKVEPIEECTDDHLFDGEPSEVEPIEESTDEHLFDDAVSYEINTKPLSTDLNKVELGLPKSRAIDLHLQCDDCKDFFKSKCKLRVHWKRVHLHQKLLCMNCKRNFKSIMAYNRHQKNMRKNCLAAKNFLIEGEGKTRTFYCKECEYKTARINTIMTHWVIHTGDKPFKCDLCPTTFTQQSSLITHKESVHNEHRAEMTCQYCGKYVKGQNKIYKHLRRHKEQSVQCPVCQKMMKNKTSLKQHMYRHSGTKSYTCEKCAHSFYTIAELFTHKRVAHNKGKISYKCDKCDYKAKTNATIKKHKAKHTDSNVPCTVCGMFLENTQKLLLHQRCHFEEKKFACPFCELKFFRRDMVPKHIKVKHAAAYYTSQPTSRRNHRTRSCVVKEKNLDK